VVVQTLNSFGLLLELNLLVHACAALQISCAWGFTTTGGAKGVGESTTSAVVISLVMIFVADFVLSFLFFQGQGDALKQLK
jgi:ABC-type transporter Mla maintaining outer membrane lipid asymmetry permease subunit MlaE